MKKLLFILFSLFCINGYGQTLNGGIIYNPFGSTQIIYAVTPLTVGGSVNHTWNANHTTLLIGVGTGTPVFESQSAIDAEGSINNYFQFNLRNNSNGASASTDFIATNDVDSLHYVDMGINSSGNTMSSFSAVWKNGAYLYNNIGQIWMGTANNDTIGWFMDGTSKSNRIAYFTPSGFNILGNTLIGSLSTPSSLAFFQVSAPTTNEAQILLKPASRPTTNINNSVSNTDTLMFTDNTGLVTHIYTGYRYTGDTVQLHTLIWTGFATTTGGVATFQVTKTGLSGGTPIFTKIQSIQCTASVNTGTVIDIPYCAVKAYSAGTLTVNAATGLGLLALGNTVHFAPDGTQIYCYIVGR